MTGTNETAFRDVILVVDDQANNLKVIGSVLGEDYNISIANNGKNALLMLENFLPDLILLDVMMPDMDGYEVCRKLKQREKTRDIPVIFLTAKSDISDIVKGFESGGVDYITKPFNPTEVKVRVKNHLRLYHSERALANRDRILHSLISASEFFLNSSEWDKNIEVILKRFSEILNISNTTIYKKIGSRDFVDVRQIFYSKKNIIDKPVISELQENDSKEISEWLTKLEEHKPVWGITGIIWGKSSIQAEVKARSLLVVPIAVDGNFWGFIEFEEKEAEKIWQTEEIETLMLIGNVISVAIKRSKVEQKLKRINDNLMNELELASSVQEFLLPSWIKKDAGLIFSSTYKPYNKIGGDFFDYLKISETLYVSYVGDVSGHGVQASLIMTAVKSIINMLIASEKENLVPHVLVNRLNRIISRGMLGSNYLTFIICLIDLQKREIRCLNAGHPPLIGYDLETLRSIVLDKNSSIPVGWLPDYSYTKQEESIIPLEDNMSYLIYTDGLFECENPQGKQLGLDKLTDFIDNTASDCYCFKLPYIIRQKLLDHQYNIDLDDFTIVSFSESNQRKQLMNKDIFIIQLSYKKNRELAQKCSQKVFEKTRDRGLADKTEILVNEFLNDINQQTQSRKTYDLIAVELTIEKEICLIFSNQGGKLQLPSRKLLQDYDPLYNPENMGMVIVQSVSKQIEYRNHSELFETIIYLERSQACPG